MNPYTSTWTGVHAVDGLVDGPSEFHLVLLDNGRTRALADEVGRAALHCIRCSACLNVCPVYERTGGHAYGSVYPGPIGAVLTAAHRRHRRARPQRLAPLRLHPVRRLLRRLPGQDQHPGPLGPVRAEHTEAHAETHTLPTAEATAMKAAAGSWPTPTGSRGRVAPCRPGDAAYGGKTRAPPPPAPERLDRVARPARPTEETFRDWWSRTRGGRHEHGSRGGPGPDPGALGDTPAAVDVPRAYRTGEQPAGTPVLVAQLVDRLEDYRATVIQVADDDTEIGEAIAAALLHSGIREAIAPAGVPAEWLRGIPLSRRDDGTATPRDLDAVPAVVTGSVTAVAETGTIVLDGSPRCGRRAITLVPDTHVCVVRVGDVVQTVPEGLPGSTPPGPDPDQRPSATSDIELSRVEGVHGPRTLIVVLAGAPRLSRP